MTWPWKETRRKYWLKRCREQYDSLNSIWTPHEDYKWLILLSASSFRSVSVRDFYRNNICHQGMWQRRGRLRGSLLVYKRHMTLFRRTCILCTVKCHSNTASKTKTDQQQPRWLKATHKYSHHKQSRYKSTVGAKRALGNFQGRLQVGDL